MDCVVVGSAGTVGRTLVEHLGHLGHTVTGVDLGTAPALGAAAAQADVVFVVTLPIEGVGRLMSEASSVMPPGSLLVHGTSVEKPVEPYSIPVSAAVARGITVSHLHFHFRPERPLRRTLYGQNVSVSTQGPEAAQWASWLDSSFTSFGPVVSRLEPGEHDQLTSISQLVHMAVSTIVARVWRHMPRQNVQQGIRLGGPPCRSLVRTVLRTAIGSGPTSSILVNHPSSTQVLDLLHQAVAELEVDVLERKDASIKASLEESRSVLDSEDLVAWDAETSQLARYEADMRKGHLRFEFTGEQNQVGLLGRILQEFDSRGIDKTSTIAQVNPDGGCTILVGVREKSSAVEEAVMAVMRWSGGI